jgi:anti-sigma factor (TIGR02949 family)
MNASNLSEAICKRIRMQLDHYLSNELSVETDHEVMKHLEACAACSQALAARMRVKNLLRRAVLSEAAPLALQQRIGAEFALGSPRSCSCVSRCAGLWLVLLWRCLFLAV